MSWRLEINSWASLMSIFAHDLICLRWATSCWSAWSWARSAMVVSIKIKQCISHCCKFYSKPSYLSNFWLHFLALFIFQQKMQSPCKLWTFELDSNGRIFVNYDIDGLSYKEEIDSIIASRELLKRIFVFYDSQLFHYQGSISNITR